MGKALVIKNADFSSNKVATVTFNDVYCTGVSFSQSSVSLTALGEATVEYTISPSNTTDTVFFTSSDESVVSIVDGDVIVNGIGTCTLSLSCGVYAASCSVSVDIYEDPVVYGSYVSSTTDDNNNKGVRYDANTSKAYLQCCGSFSKGYFDEYISVRGDMYDGVGNVTAIKIPENANKIHISAKNVYDSNQYLYFTNADTKFTKSGYDYVVCSSTVNLTTSYNSGGYYYIDQDVEVPEGVTGFLLNLRPKAALVTDFSAITTESGMKTFVETNFDLSIHYAHSAST